MQDGENAERYLGRIYKRHDLYQEHLISLTKKGKDGSEEIAQMMRDLRTNPPASLGGDEIVRIDDINNGTSKRRNS